MSVKYQRWVKHAPVSFKSIVVSGELIEAAKKGTKEFYDELERSFNENVLRNTVPRGTLNVPPQREEELMTFVEWLTAALKSVYESGYNPDDNVRLNLGLAVADITVILESWGKGREGSVLYKRLQDRLKYMEAALGVSRDER